MCTILCKFLGSKHTKQMNRLVCGDSGKISVYEDWTVECLLVFEIDRQERKRLLVWKSFAN